MSCSDVIGTEAVEVSLDILEVIPVTYLNAFFRGKSKSFVEIILSKTKPLIVGIIYRPDQSNFLEIINANFYKLDSDTKESYILDDFNINMYQNNKYIVRYDNTISSKFLSSDIKNYHQCFTMHDLKQLIKSPTRLTFSTSTLVDHILASFPQEFLGKVSLT